MNRPAGQPLPERVDVVVPGPLGWRSGGSVYNERLIDALGEAGAAVRVHEAPGAWPEGSGAERSRLAAQLEAIADDGGRAAIIDGLVGLGCPDELAEAERAGLETWILVHMSLADFAAQGSPDDARLGGLERAALATASGVIAPSQFGAAVLARRYGVSAAVARPGVTPAEQARGSRPAHLTCVAALMPGKGQLILLEALARLTDLPWTASLVGSDRADRSYARAVRNAASIAPLPSRVRVTGELDGDDLQREWLATDLSVLPSESETFGLAVADSLAHGVPALVSAGTGAEEALMLSLAGGAGLAGLAAELRDVDRLETVLRSWLTDRELRAAWSSAARAARPRLPGWGVTAEAVLSALTRGPVAELPSPLRTRSGS